jgi:DNA repair exonuclease SbcCD ATPase subunit
MSKTQTKALAQSPPGRPERSPERQALADAIEAYSEAERRLKPQRDALARIEADLHLARRDEEAAEHALEKAARVDAKALADAYTNNDPTPDPPDLALAETTLAKARRRIEELNTIRATLEARRATGLYPVEAEAIKTAVRAVVMASPAVERLVNDYAVAKQAFNVSLSTLCKLALEGMIPEHLKDVAPKRHDAYFVPPTQLGKRRLRGWRATRTRRCHDCAERGHDRILR